MDKRRNYSYRQGTKGMYPDSTLIGRETAVLTVVEPWKTARKWESYEFIEVQGSKDVSR